jgi:maleate isomerase
MRPFPAPPGRTIRIGQIVPSSNITMETEIPQLLAAHGARHGLRYTFHASRMRMHKVTKEELTAMNQEGLRCIAELADAQVDVASTACLVAHMAMGPGYHRTAQAELEAEARRLGSKAAVMTSSGALIEGLRHLGAKRIALMAPYSDALTQAVVRYIEAEGIEVKHFLNFRIEDNIAVGERDPMLLLDDLKRLETTGVDAVVLSVCVQMPSLPAIHEAQQRLGLPVTSTAICTVRGMLDRLGLDAIIPGAGALMSDTSGLKALSSFHL